MMEVLEALVGNVYVVGGRAVSAPPPGARVELPPRKVQRSREQDTFFTLITPVGQSQAQAAVYEQLAKLAADLYFRSGGSVTSGLRDVIAAVNGRLLEHNQTTGQRNAASIACLVLRGNEMYSARAGQSICMLRQGEDFLCHPENPADLLEGQITFLGVSAVTDVRLSRYEVGPGDVMVIADGGFCGAPVERLQGSVIEGRTPEVIEALKPLARPAGQAMVIEFVTPTTPNPSAAASAAPQKPATPPPAPAQPSTPIFRNRRPGRSTQETPAVPPASPAPSGPIAIPVSRDWVEDEDADSGERSESPTAHPTVEAAHLTSDEPSEEQIGTAEGDPAAPELTIPPNQRSFQVRVLSGVAGVLGRTAGGLNRILGRFLPDSAPTEEGEEPGPRIPTMVAAGLAILVPIVVVFVVVALQLSQFDLTQFEQQVREVEDAVRQADTISLNDKEQARTVWTGILQRVEAVELATGRSGDPALTKIRAKATGILDTFDKVTRVTPTPLRSYNESARITQPVIQAGVDIYALDRAGAAVYRDTLSQGLTVSRSPQPVIQRGQAVGAYAVRELIDIAWAPEGGVQRPNVLAALDKQGILVTYSPTFSPATSQRLAGTDQWGAPTAMYLWRGNLYILDIKANQIWRYKPTGNSYSNAPEPYFDGFEVPDLSLAVDIAIDPSGNMFVLFSDGSLVKYNAGIKQPFSYSATPDERGPRSGVALYLDDDPALSAFYILDGDDKSIYQFTLSGRFQRRFRATDNAFNHLSGIFVTRNEVFVASGPMLYYFKFEELQPTPTAQP